MTYPESDLPAWRTSVKLPIDVRNAPFRHKYLDEETPLFCRWMIFGRHADGVTVDIADSDGEVFVNVPIEMAERILATRNAFCDALIEAINGPE